MMKKTRNIKLIILALVAVVIGLGVAFYAFFWLPSPMLQNLGLTELEPAWRGAGPPLFPTAGSPLSDQARYTITLSGRNQLTARSIGYAGAAAPGTLPDDLPFVNFFVTAERQPVRSADDDSPANQTYTDPNQILAQMALSPIDAATQQSIQNLPGAAQAKTDLNVSFIHQGFNYQLRGLLKTTQTDAQADDPVLDAARQLLTEYLAQFGGGRLFSPG